MPQNSAIAIENNFSKGLITQATGLNFPENACTETFDCIFGLTGIVERRKGFEYETNNTTPTTKTIDRTSVAISTFLWRNVAGDGNVTLFVTQVGGTVYFWDTTGISLGTGAISSSISLSTYLASGAPSPNTIECQFSSSDKFLVVTHPYCDPFYVSYDSSSQTATGNLITLKIRDFKGDTADSQGISDRPTSTLAALDVHHHYNLFNQGWTTTNLTTWDTNQTTMPSNSDVMWRFKNSSGTFDAGATQVASVDTGQGQSSNTSAPKGHFILTLSNQNRDAASGLSGTTSTDSSYFRPATSAFFGGRVFYAGINYKDFNSSIYFTQILERDEQYAFCYQANDPTSEELFDLLPSDGGVIRIPEAGTIMKIVAISGALLIFANNGIWSITGSTGLGFKANDYTLQKLSSINAVSANSFVDVAGLPAWWNGDGIYTITVDSGSPQVKSLTLQTIKDFYDLIPAASKGTAKGYYHPVEGVVQWLYRSMDSSTPTDVYTYDRILNFNVFTGAFYVWTIPTSTVTVNSLVVLPLSNGTLTETTIVDAAAETVVDAAGDTVSSFSISAVTGETPPFKYFVSYPSGGSYNFLFAETNNTSYVDWFRYDSAGIDYTSYFVTGYKVRGQGLMKFQPAWVTIFSNTLEAVSYYFQAIWDYATTGSGTGRWSSRAYVNHTDTNYSVTPRRLKVRGQGKALQFKVTSITGEPFSIVGWCALDVGNQTP